jgi:hypothetical protein
MSKIVNRAFGLPAGILAAGIALSACVSAQEGQAPESCNAEPAQSAVGQSYSEALAEQARQSSGAATVRKIEPDMAYTMEYRGDRLNLEVDRSDVVTTVRCG